MTGTKWCSASPSFLLFWRLCCLPHSSIAARQRHYARNSLRRLARPMGREKLSRRLYDTGPDSRHVRLCHAPRPGLVLDSGRYFVFWFRSYYRHPKPHCLCPAPVSACLSPCVFFAACPAFVSPSPIFRLWPFPFFWLPFWLFQKKCSA